VVLVREITIPTERPPLVGQVSAVTDRGYRVVSAADPYARNLDLLDQTCYSYLRNYIDLLSTYALILIALIYMFIVSLKGTR
jgi:hypothetical protein